MSAQIESAISAKRLGTTYVQYLTVLFGCIFMKVTKQYLCHFHNDSNLHADSMLCDED